MMRHVIFFIIAVAPALACAQQTLSGSELKALLEGRTVESTVHDRDLRFRNYYAPDGSVQGFNVARGTKFEGTWSINDSGQFCTHFRVQGHLCTHIVKMDDGSYKRMDGAKAIATFHRIVDGNMAK